MLSLLEFLMPQLFPPIWKMVPETQRDKEANSQIYPVLQKELDII